MTKDLEILRPLTHVEEAFTLTNESFPLSVGIVLKVQQGPTHDELRSALDQLQSRHLLLQCGLIRSQNRFSYQKLNSGTQIPLEEVLRQHDSSWLEVLETELNTHFDIAGPLLRVIHVNADRLESEIVLVLHHAVMDGSSARLLLHELLHVIGGEPLPPALPTAHQVAEDSFPPAYRGWRLAARLVPFMIRQAWDEIRYVGQGVKSPIPTRSKNRFLHTQIPAPISRRISSRIGKEGLSLNSVIGASMLVAARKHLYRHSNAPRLRAIAFADLRSSLHPAPSESVLGCKISMMRFSLPVEHHSRLLDVAHRLRRQMYRAGKSGDPFLFSFMSKYLVRMSLRRRDRRLASSALSFLGKLDLERSYGKLNLMDVHAFIANNPLGPPLSGFAKVLFGRIELDLVYLDSELEELKAQHILQEIEVSLRKLAE